METTKPLISFIITTYNLPAHYLLRCIDSVFSSSLNQDEFEIVLVDDGSKIKILPELKQYQNLIRYIYQDNKGASGARNTGIDHAKGEYIQFIDGDDYLLTKPYNYCIDILKQEKPQLLLFKYTKNKDHEGSYKRSKSITGADYMLHNNLQLSVDTSILKRNILDGLRFSCGRLNEDEEFMPLLLLRAKNFIAIDANAYFYETRQESCSNNIGITILKKRLEDTKNILLHFNKLIPTLSNKERLALERRTAQLTMDYIYNTIKYLNDYNELVHRINELRKYHLFPLKNRYYTTKYYLFRALTLSTLGYKILFKLIVKTK